jgi:integrase
LDDTQKILNRHILPRYGDKPVAALSKSDVKAVLDTLQAQEKYATIKKVRSITSQVLQYALANDVPGVDFDWTVQLRKQYSNPTPQHRAAITEPEQVKGLMLAIEAYKETSVLIHLALRFSALTFARPGEVRHAEWKEIDWKSELWRIPAEKMKMRQPHLVPLATQTLEVLEQLKPISGHGKYLFPSVRTEERPISEATITSTLRRMGYSKEQMCAHGFRGMASTLLVVLSAYRIWYRPLWIQTMVAV